MPLRYTVGHSISLPLAKRLNSVKLLRNIFLSGALLLFCAGLSVTSSTHQTVPDLQLTELSGQKINPFTQPKTGAIVFVFVSNACPIANRYAPEIQRLQKKFVSKGVAFWLVHADPDETPAEIAENVRDYGYKCGVLRDPKHDLVKLAGARVTPEAAVFLPTGKLLYRGRIDNRYEDFGKQRSRPTKRDLQDAIQAVLAGKPVRASETKAIGCYIAGLQ